MNFEFWQCTEEDQQVFKRLIGSLDRPPDLVIAGDNGEPYLYRWHVIPRNEKANVYAHVQVASDPARPLHDHPWDNCSHILAGGYFEQITFWPGDAKFNAMTWKRQAGEVISRKACHAHRLIMPENVEYTMTLFTTGPKIQDWGFWIDGKKIPHADVLRLEGNVSIWTGPPVETEGSNGHYRF